MTETIDTPTEVPARAYTPLDEVLQPVEATNVTPDDYPVGSVKQDPETYAVAVRTVATDPARNMDWAVMTIDSGGHYANYAAVSSWNDMAAVVFKVAPPEPEAPAPMAPTPAPEEPAEPEPVEEAPAAQPVSKK